MSTTTKTFTVTDARYLGSKIAADLHQLQRFYGRPYDSEISSYINEFVILLKDGYLHSADYGFQRNGIWVVGVSYEVSAFRNIDQNPGRVPVGKDISSATWGSYLRKSTTFYNLSFSQQLAINSTLPIKRIEAPEPQSATTIIYDKTYGSGDVELKRKTFN